MGILTLLALAYIHMQMQIIDLAYAGNKKEQRIKKLIEMNGSTNYKILMLKSANHIGQIILDGGSDMQFADTGDIVRIEASEEFFAEKELVVQSRLVKRANSFLNHLPFGPEAEANPTE